MTEITDTIEQAPPRRLVRTNEGRWLGGVSVGLGRYFDVNPLVYRIAFAALAFAGGTGLLLYLAAWLVIPHESREESIAVQALREHRDRPWLILGVGLLGLGAVLTLSEAELWPGPGSVWLAATLAGAALVWWHVGGREPRASAQSGAPAARRQSLFLPVLGALIAAAGVVGLIDVLDVVDVDWRVVLGGGVVVVGAAVAVGAATGRRVGGLSLVGLVLLAAFGLAALSPVSLSAGVGERDEHPLTVEELESHYEFGLGDLSVDLSDLELPRGTTHVEVDLGVGDLTVLVPADAALEIDARSALGGVDVLGHVDDGEGARERVSEPGASADAPTLVLDADVGVGDLEVSRR